MSSTRILVIGLFGFATALVSSSSSSFAAGTDTDNLSVSASVVASCQITAGSTLAFGTYDTIGGAAVDSQADLSVACTQGATATITLGQGTHADAGSTDAAPERRLAAGSDFLAYSLFSDSNREIIWGNTAGTGADYLAADANVAALTVFGTVAAGQDVPAGDYTDTVVATITF